MAEPVPKVAIAVKTAKQIAPTFAHHGVLPSDPSAFFFLNARSQTYIAPPHIFPFLSLTRYLIAINVSEYFVAMPKIPIIHIQKTAPGPP